MLLIFKVQEFALYILMLGVLLISYGDTAGGATTISPSEKAPVCSGGQLEVICNTTWDLEWGFNVFRENATTLIRVSRVIPSVQPSPETSQLINSTRFYFSKTSAEGASPVMSKLLINSVSRGLNGTVIYCEDLITGDLASTTVIVMVGHHCCFCDSRSPYHDDQNQRFVRIFHVLPVYGLCPIMLE